MADQILDTRKLMTGKDGLLFVEIGDENIPLFEVDSFTVNATVTNVDVQPVGSILVFAVNSGVAFSISMSEMVVRDDVLMEPILQSIAEGQMPVYNFQGSASRLDRDENSGNVQRVVFRNCVPDGELTLMNLTPGEVIKRSRNFRINSIPEWLKSLAGEITA